jgi:excisionase family DNA binding protein
MSTDAREFRLLTVRDVAETLRVDEKTVRRKIERGLIPAYRLGPPGNSIRVATDELQAWLESERTAAAMGDGSFADHGNPAKRRVGAKSGVTARQPAGEL